MDDHPKDPIDHRAAIRITSGGRAVKNSNFTALEKNVIRRSSPLGAPVPLVVAALLLGNPGFAETSHLRVAFESVPGIEEIEAGNLQAGIEVLEDQLAQVELENSGDMLVTLCGAYIVNGSLDKAKRACDKAVEISPTKAAYNNRGVYRAHVGDLYGAREDFERVRSRELEAYIEELRIRNVPLMAADNFDFVEELLFKRNSAKINASVALTPAAIEDLND